MAFNKEGYDGVRLETLEQHAFERDTKEPLTEGSIENPLRQKH